MNKLKCDKKWHDAYGKEDCMQCLVRSIAHLLDENPFLKKVPKKKK